MKRILMVLVCLLLLTTAAAAADGQITALKTDCLVEADGVCQITQTVTVDITGQQTELLLPVADNARKPSVAGYSARRVTRDGSTYLELTSPAGFIGSRTFTVLYTVHGTVQENEAGQLLELELLCPRWEWSVERFAFSVQLPKPTEQTPRFSSGYYADVIEDFLTMEQDGTYLSGDFSKPLMDHESITMSLQLPNGYFAGYSTGFSLRWLGAVLLFALTLAALIYWVLELRSAPLRSAMRTLPPDASLPCDLPCLLADLPGNFNVLILYWATKGYLTIHVNKKGHVKLVRRMEMGNERRSQERELFQTLFAHGDNCDGASLQYKQTAQRAMAELSGFWRRRLFARTSGNVKLMRALVSLAGGLAMVMTVDLLPLSGKFQWLFYIAAFLAGILLTAALQRVWQYLFIGKKPEMLLCLSAGLAMLLFGSAAGGSGAALLATALGALSGWLTAHGGRLSRTGVQLVSQALGFRRFLRRSSDSTFRARLERDGQFYYDLLPYAAAIGLADTCSRRFADMELESCQWYFEEGELPRQARGFWEHLAETMALLEVSVKR